MQASISSCLAICLAAVLAAGAAAQESSTVYRSESPEGTVEYSDQPSPGAAERELPPLTTYSPVAPARGATGRARGQVDENVAESAYTSFSVVSPRNDAAVRANDGNVNVLLRLQPALLAGHRVSVLLDGAEVASGGATSFLVAGVGRGSHSLSAVVTDPAGRRVSVAPAITFHVLRVAVPRAGQ